jgi:hypothetical protein
MPSNKTYPQFLLLGDSIIQFGAFLRDGVSFTAGLEERKSPFFISDLPFQVTCLPGSHLQPLLITSPLLSNHFIDCQRRLDVINRGLVAISPTSLLQS